jgi:hypothetical protein
MVILKAVAFVIAWGIKILCVMGMCAAIVLLSPILIGGWAMNKTIRR